MENKGRIAPGNSIGSIVIEGDYVQGASGELELEFSEGEKDSFRIKGDASLNGLVTVKPLAGAFYRGGVNEAKLSDFIKTEGLVNVSDTLKVNAAGIKSPTLNSTVYTQCNGLDWKMVYSVSRDALSYAKYADDYNGYQIGLGLSKGAETAFLDMENLYKALDFSDMSGIGVKAGLRALTPVQISSVINSSFDTQHYVNTQIVDGLYKLKKKGNGIHVHVNQYYNRHSMGRGYTGYKSRFNMGVLFGADRVEDSYSIGLYANFNRREILSGNNSEAKATGAQIGLRSILNLSDNLKLYADSRFGFDKVESNKSVIIGSYADRTSSDYTDYVLSAQTGISYDFKLSDELILRPVLGVDYTKVMQPRISEHGNGSAIETKRASFDSVRAVLGADFIKERKAISDGYSYELGLSAK